jgi:hypothetical protein
MYSGENVVILNYSEWIIQLGLYICYFLLLVLCTKLYIYSPSKAPIYLIHQTKKNWESPYLVELELVKSDAPCSNELTQLQLGTWSGISEYTCLCYNNKNRFFTTNKKQICKHNSENNKYKNTYICTELDKIDSEILNTYNNYKFCGKFSSKTIISYHNNLANQFITSSSIDYYSTPFPIDEKGIIDIDSLDEKDQDTIRDARMTITMQLLNGLEGLTESDLEMLKDTLKQILTGGNRNESYR